LTACGFCAWFDRVRLDGKEILARNADGFDTAGPNGFVLMASLWLWAALKFQVQQIF
jgi:hypothetical protein